jgi:lysophospholipase L1-like esterase
MSSLRIVCFGDSITGARPRENYRHAYLKYSDLLQLMLEARLGIGNAEVLNRGFAGQTSGQARLRLREDVLGEAPHIVIVLIGGNDGSHPEFSTAQTRENLHAIFVEAQNAGIRVLALQYHFLPGPDTSKAWHWLVGNNELIVGVANDLMIPTLDMNPIFQKVAAHAPRNELVNAEDGVHLNPGGEMVYARAIFSRLDELKWIENPPTI